MSGQVAGSINVDKPKRKQLTLEQRIRKQDEVIGRLQAKVNAAVVKRTKMIEAVRESIRTKHAALEAVAGKPALE